MEFWSAFILGLVGSVHCAGMCGPLALAMRQDGGTTRFVGTRMVYNLGRIITYCFLGIVFGSIGKTFALVGLQQFISIAAGLVILVACAASAKLALNSFVSNWIARLKSQFAKVLFRRTFASFLLLGLLNGLLPCGLVYVACGGATATGSIGTAIGFMFFFGLGTIPVMLGIALSGQRLQLLIRFRLQKLIPFCMVLTGVVLVVRGLGLGIPYLSPDLLAKASCCHP